MILTTRIRLKKAETQFSINASAIGEHDSEQLKEYLELIQDKYGYYPQPRFGDSTMPQNEMLAGYKSALGDMLDIAANYTEIEQLANNSFNGGRSLVANITNQMITSDERYQAVKNVGGFSDHVSLLADFESHFSITNTLPKNRAFKNNLDFSLNQTTEAIKDKDYLGVKQSKNYQTKYDSSTPATQGSPAQTSIKTDNASYDLTAVIDKKKGQVALFDQSKFGKKTDLESNIFVSELEVEKEQANSQVRIVDEIWVQATESNSSHTEKLVKTSPITGKETIEFVEVIDKSKEIITLFGDSKKLSNDNLWRKSFLSTLIAIESFKTKFK